MHADMRGLTLWQPWASAIAHGGKTIENRPWPCPPPHIGTRIAIHAGKKWDKEGVPYVRERWPEMPPQADLPFGAIVAIVTVASSPRFDGPYKELLALHPWAMGPYCWKLEDITVLPKPIPCKGNRSLWRLSDETKQAVADSSLTPKIKARMPRGPGMRGPVHYLHVDSKLCYALASTLGVSAYQSAALLILNRLGSMVTCHLVAHLRPQCGPARAIRCKDEIRVPTPEWLHARLSPLVTLGYLSERPGVDWSDWTWQATAKLRHAVRKLVAELAALGITPEVDPRTLKRRWPTL